MATGLQIRGMTVFLTIWFGQMISIIGSNLTEFALSIWLFQHTHSALQFALNTLFIFIPPIIVAPLAGTLADRHSRRTIMILSNVGGALTALLLLVLVSTNIFEVWLVYAITLLFSIFSSFLFPAYAASVPMLVPKEHLVRANGLLQLATSISRTFAPLIAAVLVLTIKIPGIAVIDSVTFIVALGTLLFITIPQPALSDKKRQPILRDTLDGLAYIASNPGLLELLIFFMIVNLSSGFYMALFTPMVLSFASSSGLGIASAASGTGFLVGSLLMIFWRGPKRRIPFVMGSGILFGLCLLFMGAWASVIAVSIVSFFFFVFQPVVNTLNMVIWQTKVPPHLMGRVFSSLRLAAWSSIPLGILIAGPLADRVFTPSLQTGGWLTGSIGQIIGVGPGRGMGLLLIITGLFPIIACIKGYLTPALQVLDEEAIEDTSSKVLSTVNE